MAKNKSKDLNGTNSSEEAIYVPKMKINGEISLILSILDDTWFFKALGIFNKNQDKDHFGNKIEHVKGKGSIKCRPQNNSIFESNYQFTDLTLQKIPIKTIKNEKYLLINKLGHGDTWKFQANDVKMTAKKPKKPDPSGDRYMEAKGTKNVICSTKRDYEVKNFKYKN